MEKTHILWSIDDLANNFMTINFPEYQREPNVWSKAAKQRLMDSITREFDIASIYLYRDADGAIDCIDGRQRIGAIMSFMNRNPVDTDNRFEYRIMNEIFREDEHPFANLESETYDRIMQRSEADEPAAKEFVQVLKNYRLSIVMLAGSRQPAEFNLQFTRLNLGTIINSGEKLHAMVGDLRNECFDFLGQHPLLAAVGIPTRRYAREQVAAQILGQVFSLAEQGEYARTRHFDLQRLFKDHTSLDAEHRVLIQRVHRIMDLMKDALKNAEILKNRALTVSTVLLAWELEVNDDDKAKLVALFLDEFLCRLNWQVKKGYDFDAEYRYLIDFQRNVTQASVEKPAVKKRAEVLRREFEHWQDDRKLSGDEDYKGDASAECRE